MEGSTAHRDAPLTGEAVLVRIPLDGPATPGEACLALRGDERPFALTGAWAGGGALLGSEPLAVAGRDDDPFAALERRPRVTGALGDWPDGRGAAAATIPAGAVGGGWVGYLGYALGALVERLPAPPPRPVPSPPFELAFYDHVLRLDPAGRWWFEALWTPGRDGELRRRLGVLRRRLAAPPARRPFATGTFAAAAPGARGYLEAVAECRERIAAGEIFQANLCMRLEAGFDGDPLDLYAAAAVRLEPRYGALVCGPRGAVCSLSPELFLRRSGRRVETEPIKGTAARGAANPERERAGLVASAKDRAENVMIVDLMRNDLGRVCEHGSVVVDALAEPTPAPGLWHLVSRVSGELAAGTGDAELLRACFPPGSVTGAPKIQSMRVIAALEAGGREAYTGAVGISSPISGLELNVAIRTLEIARGRIWLGAGAGIVADSRPRAELRECLLKARPIVEAAGGRLEVGLGPRRASRRPPPALAHGERPDPGRGVFETLLVTDGLAAGVGAHVDRLAGSVADLYGQALPDDVAARVSEAARRARSARLRVLAVPGPGDVARVAVRSAPLPAPAAEPVALVGVTLPGGLGAHKWADRRLLDALARAHGGVPLIVDLDGEVLEAAHANLFWAEGGRLLTPPGDGRLRAGTVRAELIAAMRGAGLEVRERALGLDRLRGGRRARADVVDPGCARRDPRRPRPGRRLGRRAAPRGARRDPLPGRPRPRARGDRGDRRDRRALVEHPHHVEVEPAGEEDVDRGLDHAVLARVHVGLDLLHRDALADRQLAAEPLLSGHEPGPDVGGRVGDRHALGEHQVEHHLAALQALGGPTGRRHADVGVEHVEHRRARLAVDEQHPVEGRRPPVGIGAEHLGEARPDPALGDLELGEAQHDPLAARELAVGDEALEALLEPGRLAAPDEGAAALAADDLTALLEPAQRVAQGPARDAELGGELVLGREPVARSPTPGPQPLADRVLGDIDERATALRFAWRRACHRLRTARPSAPRRRCRR